MIGIGPNGLVIVFFVILLIIVTVPIVIIWKFPALINELRGIRESLDANKSVSDE